MIGWTSDEVALEDPRTVSSVSSDLPLPVDPRLLKESDLQPVIP